MVLRPPPTCFTHSYYEIQSCYSRFVKKLIFMKKISNCHFSILSQNLRMKQLSIRRHCCYNNVEQSQHTFKLNFFVIASFCVHFQPICGCQIVFYPVPVLKMFNYEKLVKWELSKFSKLLHFLKFCFSSDINNTH